MHEHLKPQEGRSARRFSSQEASEIYKRAAQIESKSLFEEDDTLSRDQLENAAKRAGLSDNAVDAAIVQMEEERGEVQKRAEIQLEKRKMILAACVGLLLMLAGGSLLLTQSWAVFVLVMGGIFPGLGLFAVFSLRHNSKPL